MNSRAIPCLVAWISSLAPLSACGPFFPDTILNQPHASLDVPSFSYVAGLYQIAGKPVPTADAEAGDGTILGQIPLEIAELRSFWQAAGIEPGVLAERATKYESVRTNLLTGITEIGINEFPTHQGAAVELTERPLGTDFPLDVADYVEAARLHAIGQKLEARALWKVILTRPENQRHLRGAWAAWMLAKTAATVDESLEWYAEVEQETAAGATDVLGLRYDAKAWRAPRIGDPIAGLHLLFEAFQGGRSATEQDLSILSSKILAENNPITLNKAAADPLVRRLMNLKLLASLSRYSHGSQAIDEASTADGFPRKWLEALEAHATLPLEDGSSIAWLLYASGRFAESRHWLELSVQQDPAAKWLQAKFDLRAGKLDEASQHLAEAVRGMSAAEPWHPANPVEDSRSWALKGATQGRLLAEMGIVALAREDYAQALESLRQAGYDEDAAYLAERVLSTDELLNHVRQYAPKWVEQVSEPNAEVDPPLPAVIVEPATSLNVEHGTWDDFFTADNRLRWQLARRLAREGRLLEAGEFLPPTLKKLWDHYLTLDREKRSGRWSGEALAAILWRQARIHRFWGAELFSTDSVPDGGIHGWSFEASDLAAMRTSKKGQLEDWQEEILHSESEVAADQAVPAVLPAELARVASHRPPNANRFHYRYVAADLAMEAANQLPDNHPLLGPLLNSAGLWLAAGNPGAADRFYQTLVKRCKETEIGQAADRKRWFIRGTDPLGEFPGQPAEIIPAAAPNE